MGAIRAVLRFIGGMLALLGFIIFGLLVLGFWMGLPGGTMMSPAFHQDEVVERPRDYEKDAEQFRRDEEAREDWEASR